MKWIKRILFTLLILIVVVVIAAAVVVFTFDPNDHKQRIVSVVKEATGRDLTLSGDIAFSLYPWLGLSLGSVQLGNAEGFGETPFASVDQAEVYVAILPLLRGEVQARTLYLEGLTLNLRKNKQGRTNWDDLLAEGDTKEPAPEEPDGGPPDLTLFDIGGIELVDAEVNWVDEQAGEEMHIAPLNLRVGALSARGELNAEADFVLQNGGAPLRADLSIHADEMNLTPPRYRFEALRVEVEANGDDLPGKRFSAVLETTLDADLDAGTVQASPLAIQSQNVEMTGWIAARQVLEAPAVEGELNSQPFNPRVLLESLGQAIETADPAVLEDAAFDLAFNATDDSATLSRLKATLDDTQITGEASVTSFTDPKIKFTLALNAINLDRYMPPEPSEGEEETPVERPPKDEDALDLPVEMLRDLNLNGTFTAGQVTLEGVRLADVGATVTAEDGLIRISGLRSQLYQGGLDGQASLDVRGDTPVFAVDSALSGIRFEPLMEDFLGKAYLTGAADLAFDLKSQGASMTALRRALGGNLDFALKDGALMNMKLIDLIARAVAFFQGGKPEINPERTLFQSLTASAAIASGVLKNGDLSLISPELLARGGGTIDLASKTIDYVLRVGDNDDGETERFAPIAIQGAFDDLDYNLDLSEAIKNEARQRVQEEIEEIEKEKKEELRERLQEELKEGLKERFDFN